MAPDSIMPLAPEDRLVDFPESGWSIEVGCACGRVAYVRQADLGPCYQARVVADLSRLKCRACGARPTALTWIDDEVGRLGLSGEPPPHEWTRLPQRRVPIPLPGAPIK